MARLTTKEKAIKINDYKKALETTIGSTAKISLGNRKCEIPYYSIPPLITCGSQKKDCMKYCYAAKSFLAYPGVRKRLVENLKAVYSSDFKDQMKKELKQVKNGVFRIHESGDFKDQRMIDIWYEVIKEHPDITFYAYSKKINLDFKTKKPKNFILIYSSENEKENKNELKQKGFNKIAKVIEKGEKINYSNPITCKGGVSEAIKCGTNCKVCFTKTNKIDVVLFEKH